MKFCKFVGSATNCLGALGLAQA